MTVHIDTTDQPTAPADLRFEPLGPAHAKLIFQLFNDPDFVRFVGDRGLRSVQDAADWIAGPLQLQQAPGVVKYALIEQSTGHPMGLCGLMQRTYLPHPDLGYRVR